MNIGVIGWWYHDNWGDAAMLDSLKRAMCPHKVVPIECDFPINDHEIYRLNHLDFLILGGGTLISTKPARPFDTFDQWGSHLQTPIGIAGLGVDAIDPKYSRAVNVLIDASRFFYVRDQASADILGCDKVQVAPDLTFSYDQFSNYNDPERWQTTPICGINLRESPGLDAQSWIRTLKRLPLSYRAIPLSSFPDWSEQSLLRQLDSASEVTADPSLYSDLDLMIGTAFHSIVFAVQAHVPVIAIAYAPKVRRFMNENGLKDYVLEPEEFEELPKMVATVIDRREYLVDELTLLSEKLSKRARQSVVEMRKFIDEEDVLPSGHQPKVSIVVLPSDKFGDLLVTLNSCTNQIHENLEILVAGGQLENKENKNQPDCYVKYLNVDDGLNEADKLNRSFIEASGEYLTWLRSGDFYALDAMNLMVNRLESEPDIDVIYSNYIEVDEDGRMFSVKRIHDQYKLFRRNVIGPCYLFRRSVLEKTGEFDSSSPNVPYDFWLRASKTTRMLPFYSHLFFATQANLESYSLESERLVRRRLWSMEPWQKRILFHFIDTDTVNKIFIRPAAFAQRGLRSQFNRLHKSMFL